MRHEIGERHLAREDERDRPGEEAEHQQQPANGFEESRRGAYNPTYLYYTFGKLEIQELRDEYRARKGGGLREFHDAFVAQGGLPIALVRQILFR